MYYLLGGSGVPNYGDELMAGGWLRYLARKNPDARVVIDTNVPSISTLLLQPENWKASHVSVVKSLATQNPLEHFWQNFERGYKFFARGGFSKYARLSAFDDYLKNTQIFHLFGGGYISDKWPHTGFLLGFAGAAQAEYGFRLVGTGLGITPISAPPPALDKTARRVLNRFQMIELRDQSSAAFISKTSGNDNSFHGLDDSFLEPVKPLADQEPALHVSCFMAGRNLDAFIGKLLLREHEIKKKFSSIKFWECAPHRDREAFTKIREAFPEAVLEPLSSLIGRHSFGKEDVMITTRFHPHLIGSRSGIRGYFIAISGDYYADKHTSVCNLGSNFKPFSQFERRGFNLDSSTEMAGLDATRVEVKNKLANGIYVD